MSQTQSGGNVRKTNSENNANRQSDGQQVIPGKQIYIDQINSKISIF